MVSNVIKLKTLVFLTKKYINPFLNIQDMLETAK